MERRRYDRIRVRYSTAFLGRSYRASGTVVGLSLLGCRALAGFLIHPDEWLGLRILVPGDEPPIYVARAEVRWFEEQEVGMEFVNMEWQDRQRLSSMIRTMEGALDWRSAGPQTRIK
jgi:hypothetical protein